MTPAYLIWQAEHQNDYLRATARARAERAAKAALLVRRRPHRLTIAAATVLRAARSALAVISTPLAARVTPAPSEGTEVGCS
jgi:hypothetical protein